jgi:hypothetical protein
MLALLAFATLAGCSGGARRPDGRAGQVPGRPGTAEATRSAEIETRPAETLYVVRRGWHIDIAFAAGELELPLSSVLTQFPGARFLSLGFGDRHYLEAKNHHFPEMLAALWPGPGLVLATGLQNTPEQAFGTEHVIAVHVTGAQKRAAELFIWKSLARRDGSVPVDSPGPYDGSVYLASTRTYSGFNTCNTWAAQVLKSAGLPVHSIGVLFAGQLWTQARRLAAQAADAAPAFAQ